MAEAVAAERPETGGEESALRDNIASKGANSYYYAHADHPDREKLEGDVARSSGGEPVLLRSGDVVARGAPFERIRRFAWTDDGKRVRVYIPLDGVGALEASQIVVKTEGETCVELRVTGYEGRNLVLHLGTLAHPITSAAHRVKPDKIVLTLRKEDEDESWSVLQKKE